MIILCECNDPNNWNANLRLIFDDLYHGKPCSEAGWRSMHLLLSKLCSSAAVLCQETRRAVQCAHAEVSVMSVF